MHKQLYKIINPLENCSLSCPPCNALPCGQCRAQPLHSVQSLEHEYCDTKPKVHRDKDGRLQLGLANRQNHQRSGSCSIFHFRCLLIRCDIFLAACDHKLIKNSGEPEAPRALTLNPEPVRSGSSMMF